MHEDFTVKQLKAIYWVAEHGSIRRAADELQTDHKSISRLIDRAEAKAATKFFTRNPQGATITPEGERIRDIAAQLIFTDWDRGKGENNILAKPGQVTIACPSAIGTYWLLPHIPLLNEKLPRGITPQLSNDTNLSRDRSREADVALRYHPPNYNMPRLGDGSELGRKRFGSVWFMPHASRNYIKEHGEIQSQTEALDHPFIEQEAPGVRHEIREAIFGQKLDETGAPDRSYIVASTPDASTIYEFVARDMGFAIIPTYVREVDPRIVPLHFASPMGFELWLYYRHDAIESEAVRTTVNWLGDCFDKRRYPYFDTVFHHPNEIDRGRETGDVIPLLSARHR